MAQRGDGGFSLRFSREGSDTQMLRTLLKEAVRVGRTRAWPLSVEAISRRCHSLQRRQAVLADRQWVADDYDGP
jgi:hypothetical protein